MVGSVPNSNEVFRLNFCTKRNICVSVSATSPSCKTLNDNFQITVGVSYFTRNRNFHYTENNGEILSLVVEGEKNRGDNLAAFGSVEYYFRLNKYAQLGAKGKFYYSFDRVEAISILPTLRIQF